MRRFTVLVVVLLGAASAAAVAGGALQAPAKSATVLIRHQVRHCHSWSVNKSPFRAAQSLQLARRGTITFTNNDVMPHRLIELSGPRVVMRNGDSKAAAGMMSHMGATTAIRLATPGVYRFRTRAGEDYMAGVKTVGEDNVLTLTVTVR